MQSVAQTQQPAVTSAAMESALQQQHTAFDAAYDYTKSTEENYAAKNDEDGQFVGEFAHHRVTLDYSYHKRYSKERQKIQDSIARKFLLTVRPHVADIVGWCAPLANAPSLRLIRSCAAGYQVVRDAATEFVCERPEQPWIVFTAGAMGAGKSHAMRWMAEQGLFPLASFVQVDPDAIR